MIEIIRRDVNITIGPALYTSTPPTLLRKDLFTSSATPQQPFVLHVRFYNINVSLN